MNYEKMAEVIPFPTNEDYCGKCVYGGRKGSCTSEEYKNNTYRAFELGYCPFRKVRKEKNKDVVN